MSDVDLDRRRWEVFLGALESALDHLSENSRFPMIVPPPDGATLPPDLADRAAEVLARLAGAESWVEAAIEQNWASRPRPGRVSHSERAVISAALDVRV